MLILKDYIVSLLPDDILVRDSYKDINGKGFVQRYLEIFGQELDDNYYLKIEQFENEFSPLTITNPAYLDYFATALGDLPRYLSNDEDFAFVLTYILSIYQAKGTTRAMEAILMTLGFDDVTIFEYAVGRGIYDDDPLTFYDTGLLYDDGDCKTCSDYDVNITTSLPLTAEIFQTVKDLISLVEPINAKLRNINWNDDPIEVVFIMVEIDENGDLIYNNDVDPELIITLVNGDLVIDGPNANKYFLDPNGNLYYIS